MDKEQLVSTLKGIGLDDNAISLFDDYSRYILEKNKEINLTSITDLGEFREKMILDSLLPLKYISFENKKVIDIGTGGGFPGALFALAGADIELLDSTKKKLDVISHYPNYSFKVVNTRAEEYAKVKREAFDLAISRAVAPLNILVELCLPLVNVGGEFVALKGKDYKNELDKAKVAISKLGGNVEGVIEYALPSDEARSLIVIKKTNHTPNKYPREYQKIKTNPIK